MNPYLDFKMGLNTLRKAINWQRILQIITLCISGSLFFTLIIFFLQTVLQIPINHWIYLLAIFFSMGLVVLLKLIKKKKFKEELTRLDNHFKLKEQLRTAYEVVQQQKDSYITEKLIQSAAYSLNSINYKKIYPLAQPYSYVFILFLVLSFYGIQKLPHVNLYFDSDGFSIETPKDSKQLKPILLKLEHLAKQEVNPDKAKQKKLKQNVNDLLQEFVKKPSNLDASESKAMRNLRLLQKELNADDIKSAEEWLSEFRSELPPPPENRFDRQEHRITPSSDRLNRLLQNLSQSDFLPLNVDIQNMPMSNQELADLLDQLQNNTGNDSQEKELGNNVTILTPQNQDTNSDPSNPANRGIALDGLGSSKEANQNSKNKPDKSSSLTGGDKTAKGTKKDPYSLKENENRLTKIEGQTGEGKQYSIQAQTLSIIGEAKLGKKDFIRSYEQDMESAFQQENIPLKQRQFIKTYFLSLENRK